MSPDLFVQGYELLMLLSLGDQKHTHTYTGIFQGGSGPSRGHNVLKPARGTYTEWVSSLTSHDITFFFFLSFIFYQC